MRQVAMQKKGKYISTIVTKFNAVYRVSKRLYITFRCNGAESPFMLSVGVLVRSDVMMFLYIDIVWF